ncbi:GLYK1 [Auxenochlorella protothecoides x Auxenochlorella symbiontica]
MHVSIVARPGHCFIQPYRAAAPVGRCYALPAMAHAGGSRLSPPAPSPLDGVAKFMLAHLGHGGSWETVPPEARARVSHYYLPVYAWIQDQLKQHRDAGERGPLIVGISAPQGCGKSTLCEELHAAFEEQGLKAVGVSIDDFYLTHTELQRVSGEHPGNRLLEKRGNALTHDLELGTATLRALSSAAGRDARTRVPRYDKSAHAGRGDRFPEDQWAAVEGPVDLVLFEGWMLGFQATDEEAAAAIDPDLVPINRALRRYKDAWDMYVHSWIVIQVADAGYAAAWRLEAEQKQRRSGKPAMTDAQARAMHSSRGGGRNEG